MKKIVFLLTILLTISLYGAEFSKIAPKTTFLYFSVNNPATTKEKLKKTKIYRFLETEQYKTIEAKFLELLPKMLGDEKIDKILPFLKQFLTIFDSPITILAEETKISKEHPIDFAFISNQKDFYSKVTPFLAIMMFSDKVKSIIKLEKQVMKGVDITILRPIKESNDYLIAIVQYEDNFIITTSLVYMELLLSQLKTKSLPTLDKNELFFSQKSRFPNSDLDFYLDLGVVSKYFSKNRDDMEKINQILNIDTLKSIFATSSINSSNIFETDMFIIGDLKKNPFIDALPKKSSITFPPFIPKSINSITAFSLNLENLFSALMKTSGKEEKEQLNEIQKSMDTDINQAIFKNIGPDFFILSDFIDEKERIAFMTNVKKEELIIDLLKKIQFIVPDFRMQVTPYLDGKIISLEKDRDFAIGFKKGYLFLGDNSFVKELMQKISSPDTQFKSTDLYKKISKFKGENQLFIGMEDGVFSFKAKAQAFLDKEKHKEISEIGGKEDRQKKVFERFTLFVIKELVKMSDANLRKYIGDYFYEMRVDGKNIIIKFIID
ncbi:hypothetical protein JXR93_12580 [bacterium]|nr:hypothetical protein [bacterium]